MTDPELVLLVDKLEDRADPYLTLDVVRTAVADADLTRAIEHAILLVDYRTRANGTEVVLCRLNRRHPLVTELTSW